MGSRLYAPGRSSDAIRAARRGADEAAFLALDGDAGIVRDFLSAAGEAIEESGLAAVRYADQREAQAFRRSDGAFMRRGGGLTSTQTVSTSRRRSAKVRSADAHDEGIAARHGLRQHLDALAVRRSRTR